jgi:predicted CXXCH cytochrome family protein
MDIRTIIVLIAACSFLFSTAYAGTAPQATSRPTNSDPLPSIKKDCAICHLLAGSHDAGELKRKLSDLRLDCHRDRKVPKEHKVEIVLKREVKGPPLADGKVTVPPVTSRMQILTAVCSG